MGRSHKSDCQAFPTRLSEAGARRQTPFKERVSLILEVHQSEDAVIGMAVAISDFAGSLRGREWQL
jgi:hypothetical protein